jgi:hypothetical protein
MRAEGTVIRSSRVTDVRAGRQRRVPWTPLQVSVLFFGHPTCAACERFAQALDRHLDDFAAWGVSAWLVEPDQAVLAAQLGRLRGVGLVADTGAELSDAVGIAQGGAGVVVLDGHGQVFYSRGLDDHDFPSIDALVVEARFPALQCPECDSPDVPGVSELPS